jgi:hypothetical protein
MRLVLRLQGSDRLLLVISTSYRLIFLGIAAVILSALVLTSPTPLFDKRNLVPLLTCLLCVLASLYLERWVFDRRLNSFERHAGLLFLFKKESQNLGELRRVVLNQHQRGYGSPPNEREIKGRGRFSRVFVTLGVEDAAGEVHKLDIARAVHVGEIRKNAVGIAGFCRIPLEDDTGTD